MRPIGILVIGDELLSGRRQDRHLAAVIERLQPRGLRPTWARYEGDDATRIEQALRASRAEHAITFCFGGIGATPDDCTRAVAARAFDQALQPHPEAVRLIEAQFGADAYPRRIQMAELPEGADLIPNPVNRVPGFSLGDHYFMPGFPQMAHPMLDWILEGPLAELRDAAYVERAVWLVGVAESELIDLMERFCAAYPELRLFSLPILQADQRLIELGLKGARVRVERAMAELVDALAERGIPVRTERPSTTTD